MQNTQRLKFEGRGMVIEEFQYRMYVKKGKARIWFPEMFLPFSKFDSSSFIVSALSSALVFTPEFVLFHLRQDDY